MIPKFRVFDNWDKVMKSVESIEWNRETKFDELELIGTVDSTDENYTEFKHPDWFVLMQSTGLHDKNGVEIYEGDIIKDDILTDRNEDIFVIEREENCFVPKLILSGTVMNNVIEPMMFGNHAYMKGIEVIGNIYENPELLEDVE